MCIISPIGAPSAAEGEMAEGENIFSRMWDENVRIDGMWPLPAVEASEEMLEAVELREELPDRLNALLTGWSEEEREELFQGDDYSTREAWSELFAAMFRANVNGYLVQASTPVFEPTGETSASFSWGHTHWTLLWANTADAALEAALAWAQESYTRDMKRAA